MLQVTRMFDSTTYELYLYTGVHEKEKITKEEIKIKLANKHGPMTWYNGPMPNGGTNYVHRRSKSL